MSSMLWMVKVQNLSTDEVALGTLTDWDVFNTVYLIPFLAITAEGHEVDWRGVLSLSYLQIVHRTKQTASVFPTLSLLLSLFPDMW